MVGVEHEYIVRRDTSVSDFRDVIHTLPIDGRRVDPGDTHAYRMPSGIKITCDGAEAEIATPPLRAKSGITNTVDAWTAAAGAELGSLIGEQYQLEGVSTHLSVTVSNDLAPRASGMFARTFAPALMLLMDSAHSPGLLVRPRHGRLEFGGEYVKGEHLSAAAILALGGTILCERAAGSFLAKSALPPPVRLSVERAKDRYGWFVARDAFGFDLYTLGRDATFRRELVGRMTARRQLDRAWSAARSAVENMVSPVDLAAGDAIVAGDTPLPLETEFDPDPPRYRKVVPEAPATGGAMRGITTPRFELRVSAATWGYTVFSVLGSHNVHVAVPEADLAKFLSDSREGRYDAELADFPSRTGSAKTLRDYHDATRFGFWSALDFSPRLAPPERGIDGVERLAGQVQPEL